MEASDIKSKIRETNDRIKAEYAGSLSVSKCIEYVKKPFDAEEVAKKCFYKGFDDPQSKYYQMSVKAIMEAWDAKGAESARYGSLSDDYIRCRLEDPQSLEMWKLDNNYDNDARLRANCDAFDNFNTIIKSETDYQYVDREVKMFITTPDGDKTNGRLDCLFYSPSRDRLLVIDWKTSASIDKSNKWDKLLGPLNSLDACNGNEYTIQLHMYKKALSETYSILPADKIDVFICQFTPDHPGDLGYIIHNQNFDYDSELLNKIISYAYKKHELLNENKNKQ